MFMKRKKRVGAKKKAVKTSTIIKVSLVIIVIFVIFATTFKITEFFLTQKTSSFPKLEINLKDVPIEQINLGTKDIKYPNNTVTISTNNETLAYEDVEIKGRGNFTWLQAKKPYQLKFSEKADLFNLGTAKKWLLLADYLDESHLRNNVAFYLQYLLDSTSTIGGQYAEIYIDNVYYGLYYVTEKIEIGKNRIDLKDPLGAIIELDNLHTLDKIDSSYSDHGDHFSMHDIINDDNTSTVLTNFVEKFNQLETAIAKKDFNKINNIIDIDSFAKYFLLNEFANNPDAYASSFFFYMDGEKDKIHAGPGWDFDLAFGSEKWMSNNSGINLETFLSPYGTMTLKNYLPKDSKSNKSSDSHLDSISPILYNLMDIPEFETRVKEIYQDTLSGKNEELLDYIGSQASYIREAALRDQERWKLKTSFDDEVDRLVDWIAKRYDHFEETYGINADVNHAETFPSNEEF